MIDAIRYSPQS